MNSYSDFGDYGEGGGYDAGGGFSRGGNSGTPDKKGGGKEPSMQTVTPLTARMILDAHQNPQDDTLTIDGKQISKVVLCGQVVSVDSRESYIEYRIDDGTGVIAVSKVNDKDQADLSDTIEERSYVTVHGGIITVQGERKIRCHFIRQVQDHNEITHHLLSTVFNHYQNTKGPLNDGSKILAAHQAPTFGGFGSSSNFNAGGFNQPVMGGAQDHGNGAVDNDTRMVHDAIASDMSTDTGLSVHQITDMLKSRGGFTLQKVKNICSSLMTEGYVYSTIDDDHFKSTGSLI